MWDRIVGDLALAEQDWKIIGTLVMALLAFILRQAVLRIMNRRITGVRERIMWRQTINFITLGTVILLLFLMWFTWIHSFITLLSVVAAALTIVSKEAILNFVAYWIIIWRALFKVGDRVFINGATGDILEMGPLYLTLAEVGNGVHPDDPTGQIVKIPNSDVLSKHVRNFSRGRGFCWRQIQLEVPLDKQWERARDNLAAILASHSVKPSEREMSEIRARNEELMFPSLESSVHIAVEKDKVRLTGRYLGKINQQGAVESRIWEQVLREVVTLKDPREKEEKEGKGENT